MGLSKDARTGAIATLVIVLVAWGISFLTSISQKKNWGTPYHIIFNRVEGVEEGTPVYWNGQLVGHVRSMAVRLSDMKADVTISVNQPLLYKPVVLTDRSFYTVEGGLWGAQWINIQYRDGTPVPPGGQVNGTTVDSWTSKMRSGVEYMRRLQALADYFQKEVGTSDAARRKIKAQIRYWNYMAFDLRVQANRFNQFSGLINQRLGMSFEAVDHRITLLQDRSRIAVAQMGLFARGMQLAAIRKDAATHEMVIGLLAKMLSMQETVIAFDAYIGRGDSMMTGLLGRIRHAVDDAQEKVAALHFVMRNLHVMGKTPRALAASIRKRIAEMRAAVDKLRGRLGNPQGTGAQKHPPAGSSSLPGGLGVPLPATSSPSEHRDHASATPKAGTSLGTPRAPGSPGAQHGTSLGTSPVPSSPGAQHGTSLGTPRAPESPRGTASPGPLPAPTGH